MTRLEELAANYDVKIKFCPKFHCEMNAIEGVWCHQKQFIRKRTDQTYPTLLRLISESRTNFKNENIAMKLFRRFWRVLNAYHDGGSYEQVLHLFYSNLCKGAVQSHRKITNTNFSTT